MEGGANVISEACVAGTPILTTRIEGSIGFRTTGVFQFFRSPEEIPDKAEEKELPPFIDLPKLPY